MNSSDNPDLADFLRRLERIRAGIPKVQSEKAPDKKDQEEVRFYEKSQTEIRLKNEWLLVGLREKYGTNVIRFMWVYFIFTGILLTFHGFHWFGFELPDIVLAALIGGTAVSVLGVVGTIASGLFRPPTPSPPKA